MFFLKTAQLRWLYQKLREAQRLLSASQSLVTDADLALVFDGSSQANEAVSSTPRSPQQEQSTDSKNN